MTSSLPPVVQACSAALGSACANAISYPLDLVATKVQTTKNPRLRDLRGAARMALHIIRTQGVSGLYDGLATDTASTVLSNFLYFYFYAVLHALVARRRSNSSTVPLLTALRRALTSPTAPVLLGVPAELAVGFVAGVASRAISTPLGVLTVQLQSGDGNEEDEENAQGMKERKTHKEKGSALKLIDVVQRIYAEQGISGFWAGFVPTIPLSLTPALTLLFFQLLRRLRIPFLSQSASTPTRTSIRAFFDGAFPNALALALLYPLVLAKVRVQAWRGARRKAEVTVNNPARGGSAAPTMLDVWSTACAERGLAGLYDGLGAQVVKGFVSQGVTMMIKQRIEQTVVKMYLRGRP